MDNDPKGKQLPNASHAGIYVDYWGGPFDKKGFRKLIDQLLSLNTVSGIAMNTLDWSKFEPREGRYEFSYFDVALELAKKHGKSIAIGIRPTSRSPEWLLKKAPTVKVTHPHAAVGDIVVPVPWDPTYTKALDKAIQALGKRYDGHPNLYYVQVCGPSSLFGVEFNWPMKKSSLSAAESKKLNFTLKRFVGGWKRSFDVHLNAFPKTLLTVALHHQVVMPGVKHADVKKAVREFRDYAIKTYARRRNGQKVMVQLLGLTYGNRSFFDKPLDAGGTVSDYAAIVHEVRDRVRIGFEPICIFRQQKRDDAFIRNVFRTGLSYDAELIKMKFDDVWDLKSGSPYSPYKDAMVWGAAEIRRRATKRRDPGQ